MRTAATASRHGTAVSRASRAVLLLLGVTAAVWCTSVLLAAPAEADDGGLDLGGLGDTVAAVHGGLVDTVAPARSAETAPAKPRPRVADAARPVVDQEPVVRHAVRPVVRRVEPGLDPRAAGGSDTHRTDQVAPQADQRPDPGTETRAALGDVTEQPSGLSGPLGPIRPRTADAPRASAVPTLAVAVVGRVGATATAEVPTFLQDVTGQVLQQVLAPVRDLTSGLLATLPGTVEALGATVSSLVPAPDGLAGLPLLVDPLTEPGAPQATPARSDRATQQRAASRGVARASVVPGTDAPERAQHDVTPAAPVPSTPYDAALPDTAASSGGGAGVPLLAPACLDAWALPVPDTDAAVRGHRTATTSRPSGRPDCPPD